MIAIKRFFNLIIWKFIHNSLEYRLNKLYEFDKTKKYPEVKSINETIDKLLNSNCSIVRFGDGEFNLSLGRSISFQTKNRELSRELQKILKSKNQSEILVAISPFTPKIFTKFEINFWFENIFDIAGLLDLSKTYYSTSVTRQASETQFELLRKIWDKKEVIFVFGENSRFKYNHELFDNTNKKHIVLSKAKNAWNDFDITYEKTIKIAQKCESPIVICALGPTATVLAYKLALNKVRALDIGHLTNIFDVKKYGAPIPEQIV